MERRSDLASAAANDAAMEWLDLRQLTQYAAVSERTLHTWIHDTVDPLPAYQVGTKILVRKRDFDSYIERHPLRPAGTLANVVNEIVAGIKG
jgi:excisionase family DNA binding protein